MFDKIESDSYSISDNQKKAKKILEDNKIYPVTIAKAIDKNYPSFFK